MADDGIPEDGFDTLSWSEIKDWRSWERTRRARRRPLSRRLLVGLCITFVVTLGLSIALTAASPHLWVIGWLAFAAVLSGISLIFSGLAHLGRRRRHAHLFDQDQD
jgi:hypothetical protein